MTDQTTRPPADPASTHGDETFEWTGEAGNGSTAGASGPAASAADKGREWLTQLQSMIENAATQAAPVMREVAAKAAELAAVAGEKAGPVAAKAAEMTADAGKRVAEKSRDFAEGIRREQAARAESGTADAATSDDTTATPSGTGSGY
jgi:hypothetical protein